MLDLLSSMELSRGSLLTSKGKTCFILLIYTQLLNSSLAIKCATFKVIRIKSFFSLPNHTSTKSTLVQANVQCMQYVSLNCIYQVVQDLFFVAILGPVNISVRPLIN